LSADLTDPALYRSGRQFDAWRQARAAHPVAWTDSERFGAFWSVTGYELGSWVLKRSELFTSGSGMRLGADPSSVQAASNKMLVVSDGDDHRRFRRAHAPYFTGRGVARLGADLARELHAHLDGLVGERAFDVVAELSSRIPTWTVCAMLGVPRQDWSLLAGLAATSFDDAVPHIRRKMASAQIFAYFWDLVEVRRTAPGDDIVSALLHPPAGAPRLSDEEIVFNCDGLVNGGLGTTRHAISDAVVAFAENPAQWQQLVENPHLVDSAVEEVLRWTCAPLHVMRTATRDVQVGDAQVRRGDRVVVWIPSCNRDETHFDDPERFRVDRRGGPALSFGGGPHYCIGAPLARMELRILVRELASRVHRFDLAGEVVRRSAGFLLGIDRLEVVAAKVEVVPQ
jgi:cytochrome P450